MHARRRELAFLLVLLAGRPRAEASGAAATKLVPIVLDVAGLGGARYATELTLANRGTTAATVQMTYTPATALGATGAGTAGLSLAAGRQTVIADAVAWLRSQGVAIPTGSNQGGTLAVSFSGLSSADAAYVGARTTTPSGSGRAGLAYPGVDLSSASTGTTWLYGLRSSTSDRTNLALANAGAAPVTLRVTLHSGNAGDGRSYVLSPDTVLAAGQWTQFSRVLDLAGFTNAYARIDVVSGTGPYVAYAVFNDNTTNDGSYVAAEPAPMPSEARLLPVLVESASYQSELVLTNPLTVPQTAVLDYVESADPAAGAGGSTTVSLAAGEQKILPGAIDYLRQNRVTIGPKGPTYAGALSVTFRNGANVSSGFAGARTSAPVNGTGPGEYGLFYAGIGPSYAATFEAWVYGLAQDAGDRSNLAVANLGDAGDSVTVRVDVYDGDTGRLAGSLSPAPLPPGGWAQLNGVLQSASFSVANGYAHVVKTSGRSRFLAYGVVNDGGAPGKGTSDGSYVAAVAVPVIASFTAGPDVAVTYPPGLPYVPDEMTTFVPLGGSPTSYRVFASIMSVAVGNGAVVLETADLKTFTFAPGYTSPVMTSSMPFTKCKPAYDPQFDLNYAGPGAVLQDPTRPAGNLVMIYEAENHCPGAVWQGPYYVTVGLARSSDGGKSWPQPIDAELGGPNRYVALKGPVPEPSTPENPPIPLGTAIPNAYLEGNDLYVTYNHEGSDFDGVMRVARATLGTSEPITFTKWYQGAFSQPGIGGEDTGVLPAKGCVGYQTHAQISRYDPLGIYLMTFACISQGSHQGGWYFSTATSLESQNWTAPRLIQGSLTPLSPCSATNSANIFDGWYPSFVSPGAGQAHLAPSGSVFFLNGCITGSRTLSSRNFTISSPPPPVLPVEAQ